MTPEQYEKAECRLVDAALFDPPTKEHDALRRIDSATTMCRRCPLIGLCLSEAVRDKASGVRGGMLLSHGKPVRLPSPTSGHSPGRSALQEAARLETARIYGQLCREFSADRSESVRPVCNPAVDLDAARYRRKKKAS